MDACVLRSRLSAIMQSDPHAIDGRYFIRSLYFDTPEDTALREKTDGVSRREKFRIRCYNHDPGLIRLEKKSKVAGLCSKSSANLTPDEVRRIIAGDIEWMLLSPDGLVRELYAKMKQTLLRPRTIVDYTREPFVYGPGNVRVTLDYDIRTGLGGIDLLDPGLPTVPAGDGDIILEVKWDEYLPDIIRAAVQLESRQASAFSKYAQCRIYG